jgi:hypothetical protein
MCGIAIALHLDLREGLVDPVETLAGQFHARRAEILFQPMQLGGSWDRHDSRALRQQPGQRDLRRRDALAGGDLPEKIDECLIGLQGLGRKARHDPAEILVAEGENFDT